jgi:predicted transposase YdaD
MEARLEDITRGLTDEHRAAVRQTILLRMKKEGRKLGRKEGMAKGLEKGRMQERVERVLAMHAKGVSPEQIAYLLDIPISTVKEILSAADGDQVNGSR